MGVGCNHKRILLLNAKMYLNQLPRTQILGGGVEVIGMTYDYRVVLALGRRWYMDMVSRFWEPRPGMGIREVNQASNLGSKLPLDLVLGGKLPLDLVFGGKSGLGMTSNYLKLPRYCNLPR